MLVLAIINVVIAMAGGMFPIDGILMLCIAIWWKKVPSRPCAITALVFAIVEMLISLIVFSRLTGWLILVGAVYMMIQSKKLTDSYNTFRQSH